MSIPITIAIVLVSSQNDVPFASAISRATRETLGANAQVVVKNVDARPTDDEALAIETAEHADAVAIVVWLDPQRTHASLRVHVESPPHWIARDLGFGPMDATVEEGRTLGFALASMMPEVDVASASASNAAPPALPVTAGATQSATGARTESEGSAPTDSTPSSGPTRAPVGSIGAFATAAISFGGEGGGIGGALDGRYFLTSHLAVRAALGARAGDVDKADARLLSTRGSLGVAWRSSNGSRKNPFTYGFRGDIEVAYLRITRGPAEAGETQSRWLPAAQALFEGAWSFNDAAALSVGAGPELLFGSTDVIVNGARVTDIAPLTLVFELGLSTRF